MPSLSVVTLNLHLNRDRWISRRELVVAQLLDLSPDVIALQEVALPIRQAHWLRNQLNARAGMTQAPYWIVQARRGGVESLYEGLAILSRLPILSHDVLRLSFGRIALRANIELSTGETVDVANTHLYSRPNAHHRRDQQVMRIMGWLDGGGAVSKRILLGCFRDVPDSLVIQRLKTFFSFRSAFETVHGYEPCSTWPTALNAHNMRSGLCHDYIFVSPRIGQVKTARLCCVEASATDAFLLPSDHAGILAEIVVS